VKMWAWRWRRGVEVAAAKTCSAKSPGCRLNSPALHCALHTHAQAWHGRFSSSSGVVVACGTGEEAARLLTKITEQNETEPKTFYFSAPALAVPGGFCAFSWRNLNTKEECKPLLKAISKHASRGSVHPG